MYEFAKRRKVIPAEWTCFNFSDGVRLKMCRSACPLVPREAAYMTSHT